MIHRKGFFSNLFSSDSITPMRMLTFTRFVIAALTALGNSFFDAIIAKLTASADALYTEMSAVDINLTDQKESTSAVRDFIKALGVFMKEQEVNIAATLGGYGSAGYKAFYPHNVSEYTRATLGRMPVLLARLLSAANKYTAQLPPTLAAALKAFAPTFAQLAHQQKNQITTVNNDRIRRTQAYTTLQLQLTTAMHLAGAEYPGQEAFCLSKFPLHLLYAAARARQVTKEGTLAAGGSEELLNHTLTTGAVVTIRNTGTNAGIAVWLGAVAGGAAPATAVVVAPGDTKIIKAAKLGTLGSTFLMIANSSTVNGAAYNVQVSGLKKEKKAKKAAPVVAAKAETAETVPAGEDMKIA